MSTKDNNDTAVHADDRKVVESSFWRKLFGLHKNVYGVGLVGFFIQIGTSIIYSTIHAIFAGKIFTQDDAVLIRNLSDCIPNLVKGFVGYLSDRLENRFAFLFIGYGFVWLFKTTFFIAFYLAYIPSSSFAGFLSTALLLNTKALPGILYTFASMGEKTINHLRDVSRDALITDSTPLKLRSTAFGIRKILASAGTVVGGLSTYFILKRNFHSPNFDSILTKLFSIPTIIPSIIGIIILFTMVRNVKYMSDEEKKGYVKKKDTTNVFFKIFLTLIPSLILGFSVKLATADKSSLFNFFSFKTSWSNFFGFLSGLIGFVSIYGFTKSEFFNDLKENKNKLGFFGITLLVSSLLFFVKISENAILNQAINVGLQPIETILFFTITYIIITISSLMFSYLLDKKQHFVALLIVASCSLFTNCLLGFTSTTFAVCSSIIPLGVFIGGVETVLTTFISLSIPTKRIRGIIFGIFYSSMGIVGIISSCVFQLLKRSQGFMFVSKTFFVLNICIIVLIIILKKYFDQKMAEAIEER